MSDEEMSNVGLEEEAETSSAEDESSSEEEMEIEYLAPTRQRRSNAGNKMMALIESSVQEDEFYKTAYEGGFNENDEDAAYESPGHAEDDEVDSDFDRPEEEDDEPNNDKEDEEKLPRKKKAYKEPQRGELLGKNKWAVARMGGPVVAANVVDAKTQAQRLKEAEHTEKVNVESLKRYEAIELDKKKKREKAATKRKVPPPFTAYRSNAGSESLTVPELKTFEDKKLPVPYICAVTGRPAKYKDPLTNLPYSSTFAFKVIRDQYNKFLLDHRKNPEVSEYLSQFVL